MYLMCIHSVIVVLHTVLELDVGGRSMCFTVIHKKAPISDVTPKNSFPHPYWTRHVNLNIILVSDVQVWPLCNWHVIQSCNYIDQWLWSCIFIRTTLTIILQSDLYFWHCPLLKYASLTHHIHGHVLVLFLPGVLAARHRSCGVVQLQREL